jgi:hypothetical protein
MNREEEFFYLRHVGASRQEGEGEDDLPLVENRAFVLSSKR